MHITTTANAITADGAVAHRHSAIVRDAAASDDDSIVAGAVIADGTVAHRHDATLTVKDPAAEAKETAPDAVTADGAVAHRQVTVVRDAAALVIAFIANEGC